MNQRLIFRGLFALTLMMTLGFVTIATTPKASAHSLTCGSFTTVVHRSNLVADGVTIGYGEMLTDGCKSYELHGHLSTIPAGSARQFDLVLDSQNGNYIFSKLFTTTPPPDLYLPEPGPGIFSPRIPSAFGIITDFSTDGGYYTLLNI